MPTAAKVLLDTLVAHNIDRAFCVPGESYLSVMDELHGDPVLDLVTAVMRVEPPGWRWRTPN